VTRPFGELAPLLIKQGYRPLPIRLGSKAPAPNNWTNYQFKTEDAQRYANCGTGLLLGETIAIDIDVSDASLASKVRKLAEKKLGTNAPDRIGQTPKRALLYGVEGNAFAKLKTRGYHLPNDGPEDKPHAIEILAQGQQLVAYAMHPGTGKPYKWNGAGEPLTVSASELPRVTRERVEEFIRAADALLAKHGNVVGKLTALGTDGEAYTSKAGLRAENPALLRSALAVIPNDDESYDDWCYLAYAIKGALGDDGLNDWMAWSAKSDKHDETESLKTWKAAKPERIGAGTIFHLAKQFGWVRPSSEPRTHKIELKAGEAARALSELIGAVPSICEAEQLMVYGGLVTHPYTVERSGFHGRKVNVVALNVLSARAFASHINAQVEFTEWKHYKDGPAKRQTDCPVSLVQTLLDRADLVASVPIQVRGLCATPVWRNGELICASGYDPISKMWITAPDILLPERPTRTDALKALEYLRGWLSEFAFTDERSAAAAVGLLITAAMRASIPHAPMFVANKHEHGEGGSTLCTLATVVQTGREPAVICVNAEDGNAEIEKRIDSAQLAGEMTICLDNWRSGGVVNLISLATIITEAERKVRILGESRNITCPNSQLVLVNGRNISVADDFIRRSVEIALDTKLASPDARTFKRPNIIADAMRDRAEILTACFTIIAAYDELRRHRCKPKQRPTPRAGFNDWVDAVAAPLLWLGLPDISAVSAELRAADPELSYIARLLPAWVGMCEALTAPCGVTVSQILGSALNHEKLREVQDVIGEATAAKVFDGRPQLQSRAAGNFLRRIAGRRVGDQRLVSAGMTGGAARWVVERLT
jgi:hypothetical protein